MACNNDKCKYTNYTYDKCSCIGDKNCSCQPEDGSCCCNK